MVNRLDGVVEAMDEKGQAVLGSLGGRIGEIRSIFDTRGCRSCRASASAAKRLAAMWRPSPTSRSAPWKSAAKRCSCFPPGTRLADSLRPTCNPPRRCASRSTRARHAPSKRSSAPTSGCAANCRKCLDACRMPAACCNRSRPAPAAISAPSRTGFRAASSRSRALCPRSQHRPAAHPSRLPIRSKRCARFPPAPFIRRPNWPARSKSAVAR